MGASAGTESTPPRGAGPWARAAGLTFGPALAPFFLGPLGECDHCIGVYASLLPVAPGAIGMLAPLPTPGRIALSGTLTLVVLLLALLSQRSASTAVRRALGGLLVTLAGLQALGLASALRM